jgi:serine/threonine protein phosphatase PrpC
MGQGLTLERALTTHFVQRQISLDGTISLAATETQNIRSSMEDITCMVFPLAPAKLTGLLSLCDGHSGRLPAYWTTQTLPDVFKVLKDPHNHLDIQTSLMRIDQAVLNSLNKSLGGTTLVGVVFTVAPDLSSCKATVFHLGDSRCILIRADNSFIQVTQDHKPDSPLERERIEAAGHSVHIPGGDYPARIDASLGLSRALGDAVYKRNLQVPFYNQAVTSLCDVTDVVLSPGDFLLLLCDGYFETQSSADVVKQFNDYKHKHADQFLVDQVPCLQSLVAASQLSKSADNHSAVLLPFSGPQLQKPNKPYKCQVVDVALPAIVVDTVEPKEENKTEDALEEKIKKAAKNEENDHYQFQTRQFAQLYEAQVKAQTPVSPPMLHPIPFIVPAELSFPYPPPQ